LEWLATLFLHKYELEDREDSFAKYGSKDELQQATNQAAAAAQASVSETSQTAVPDVAERSQCCTM
jgi:hypothetical protein